MELRASTGSSSSESGSHPVMRDWLSDRASHDAAQSSSNASRSSPKSSAVSFSKREAPSWQGSVFSSRRPAHRSAAGFAIACAGMSDTGAPPPSAGPPTMGFAGVGAGATGSGGHGADSCFPEAESKNPNANSLKEERADFGTGADREYVSGGWTDPAAGADLAGAADPKDPDDAFFADSKDAAAAPFATLAAASMAASMRSMRETSPDSAAEWISRSFRTSESETAEGSRRASS